MRLVLVRHAIAQERHPQGDMARALTWEGRKKALEVFEALAGMDLAVERVLSSPMARALETAQLLKEVLKLGKVESTKALLPEAAPEGLTAALKAVKAECVAMVGHEPFLSRYASWATGGGRYDVRKCGVVILEGVGLPGPGGGVVAGLFAPRHLRPLL